MADEKIEIKPETEKPKKANKILLGISAFLLAGVLGYFMLPSDSTPTKQEETVATTAQSSSTISSQLKEEQERKQQEALHPTVQDADGVTQQMTPAQLQQQAVANQPAPLTPREQFEEQQEQQKWARDAQNKLKAEQEQIKANQSGIFIALPSQGNKQSDKESTTTKPQSVNEYYNATSNSDYIRVVSDSKQGRGTRSER